jgi:uridylate kinase
MKHLLLALLLTLSLASSAQVVHPHHRATQQHTTAAQPVASPKVYVCGGGAAYAYHTSDGCAGLNRCSHGVSAVTVAEAEGMGRRPCKKCY